MFGYSLRCTKCHNYTPDRCICNKPPECKGVKHGNCNRTACQRPGATWYNKGTYKYYCRQCAYLINDNCDDGDPLCTEEK